MLTPEEMLALAAELTDAQADDDTQSLAAIAWQLYRQAGEHLAELGRLRAAIHTVCNRPPVWQGSGQGGNLGLAPRRRLS
jgi:hypothetical protein